MIKRPVVIAAIGFAAGDALAIQGGIPLAALAGIVPGAVLFRKMKIPVGKAAGVFLILFLFGYFLGAQALSSSTLTCYLENQAAWNQVYNIRGTVEKVKSYETYTQIILKNVQTASPFLEERRILLYTKDFAGSPGDVIEAQGTLQILEPPRNSGEFDARWFYKTQHIQVKMQGVVTSVTPCRGFRAGIERFRRSFLQSLDNITKEKKERGLLKSILLGEKGELDQEVNSLFQENGIAHILAISGLHVSMLGMALYRLLRKTGLSFGWCAGAAAFFILCYGQLTGNSVSTLRAAVMFIVSVYAGVAGRRYDIATACALAGLWLLMEYPLYLTHCGFLLSFGAIVGLAAICGPVGRAMALENKKMGRVKQAVLASLSVTLATLPVMCWFYYEISPYSVLLNLVVIPLMSLVMAGGAAGGLLGMFCAPAGIFCVGSACCILRFYEALCRLFSRLPGHVLITGRPTPAGVALYYAGLTLAVFLAVRKGVKRIWPQTVIIGALFILLCPRTEELAIHMLDVGQGDCLMVEAKGKYFLVDCGSSDVKNLTSRRILPYLKSKGITKLSGVFITHFDADHYNGLEELMESPWLEIENLFYGGCEMPEKLCALAAREKIPMISLTAGQQLEWQKCSLEIYQPRKGESYRGENEASLTFLLRRGDFSLLFTGDLEGKGEKELISGLKGGCTVLKVAHHGSSFSTPAELLHKLNPRLALISCGKNNTYGHPHPKLLERLEENQVTYYATPHFGEITLVIGEEAVEVKSFLKTKDNQM